MDSTKPLRSSQTAQGNISDPQEDAMSVLSTGIDGPILESQDEDARSIVSESIHSVTSTFKYGHETFETYRIKVARLCREIWPAADTSIRGKGSRCAALLKLIKALYRRAPPTPFSINRGPGGSFNRIVEIEVKESSRGASSSYMLRIPRFENARPDRDLAILEYVRQYYPSVPVAIVVKSDFTSDNVIEKPYLLQKKLSGFPLHSGAAEYLQLTHLQRLAFASQFATILRTMFEQKSKGPGLIELVSPTSTAKHSSGQSCDKFCIQPFEVGRCPPARTEGYLDAISSGPLPEYTSPSGFLQSQLGRWQADAEIRGDELEAECMHKLSQLAAQLNEAGFLGKEGDGYVLSHRDLANGPQNVLIDVDEDGKLSITGILDWDSAIFAPEVVACQPPMWIWAWNSDGYEDEKLANENLPTVEARQLRKAFEDAVGPEWLRLSYGHGFRLARKLCEFAFDGVHSSWKLEELQELFHEWAAMRPEGMEKIDGPMDDEDNPNDTEDSDEDSLKCSTAGAEKQEDEDTRVGTGDVSGIEKL